MTRIKFLVSVVAIIISQTSFSQNSHTLLTIGDNNYSIEEFDFIYNKNNSYTEDPKTKKEYIDLFVNYKLKVHEAMAQGMDTLASFKKEYNYYKNELAKPYLSNKEITENLKKEAYNRLTQEVDASHILIRFPNNATPDDTLKAYTKIKEIQDRIKKGEDFNKLAQELSEDPSAKKNLGRLGFFSGFSMVYPFESAAYNTPINEVSDIVRTKFGYHLIKVHAKRQNRGELRTAHIMMMFPSNSPQNVIDEKKAKIDSIYQLVLNGEDFGALAQNFSEDRNSAKNNGELPWFGAGRMIPEFSEPAFKLDSIGAVSKIIRTPYGFHIIKLLEKRGIKSYEDMEEEITQKISRDERAYKGKESVIKKLKKEYNFTQNDSLLSLIKAKVSDDNFFNEFNDNDIIASYSSEKISIKDLFSDLKGDRQFQSARKNNFIEPMIQSYIDDKILEFEKTQLEKKYPEYNYLLQEYHDGLLIFEISQKEIWNKASQDSTGIKTYFNNHKSDYYTPEKLVGKAYFAKDKKTYTLLKKQLETTPKISTDSLKLLISANQFKCINGEFSKGEYAALDKDIWNLKKSDGRIDKDFPYGFAVGSITPKEYKELEETKGQVISDYQNEIEKQWIDELKSKFNPVVNLKALKYSKKIK